MFFLEQYLPRLELQTHNVSLSILEKAEVLEDTAGTLIKIFFAFFWQESIIDLGGELLSEYEHSLRRSYFFLGLNLSPEINAFGAALLPHLNMFANNLTLWDLSVEDIQEGGGYPGSLGCNNLIPHAKVRFVH